MVRRLLLAAMVIAAAAAAGEYDKKLVGCGCDWSLGGNNGVQTYNLTSGAYCPTTTFPTCDVSKMTEAACTLSCQGPRAFVTYRNNSAYWSSSKSVSCANGGLKNAEGKVLWNLLRPTCGYKQPCNNCTFAFQPSCPAGMTCKEANLVHSVEADDCGKLTCEAGTLKLYNAAGAPLAYTTKQLFCTVASKWSNYSVDGSTVGGVLINETITANCVLPLTCEACVPKVAASLGELPASFQSGYELGAPKVFKEAGSCSTVSCDDGFGFDLYGFSGNAAPVTGLEYTSRGSLICDVSSQWTNGGWDYAPSNILIACLKVAVPTTTVPPTTTTTPRLCTTCAQNTIEIRETGWPMEENETTTPNGCLFRAFICTGTNAQIDIFGVDGALGSVVDGGTGIVKLKVICNGAGQWTRPSSGTVVTAVQCSALPPTSTVTTTTANMCQNCAQNQIEILQAEPGAKPMDGDMTETTNGCLERTFTCMGTNAKINVFSATNPPGTVEDGGTGIATLSLMCNGAGQWESVGLVINVVECVVEPTTTTTAVQTTTVPTTNTCTTCAQNLIQVIQIDSGSKPMDGDVTITDVCLFRKFTCTGTNARIDYFDANSGNSIGSEYDQGTGIATFSIACNEAGKWMRAGAVITAVECFATTVPTTTTTPIMCQSCAQSLIEFKETGYPMGSDTTVTTGGCLVRTITCDGTSVVMEVFSAAGSLGSVGDEGLGGVTLTVTCTGAGQWEAFGSIITAVSCSKVQTTTTVPTTTTTTSPSSCTSCAQNSIEITQNGAGAKPMDLDKTVTTNGCLVRKFDCMGENAAIEIFTASGSLGSEGDEGTGWATYSVNCNGSGLWEGSGVVITAVECSSSQQMTTTTPTPNSCTTCIQSLVKVKQSDPGAKPMDGDVIITDVCLMRKFTCSGTNAKIEYFDPNGALGVVDDQGTGTATFAVSCNGDGKWMYNGAVITEVECFVTIPT